MSKSLAVRPGPTTGSVAALLDPSGLGPIPAIPLVPEASLKKHHIFIASDQRFKAAARLLQALYREDRDLPAGSFIDADGKRKRLGSSISRQAGRDGGNFLVPAIAQVVHRELVYREIGSMIDTDRLRTNLLSSMPLTFNLFGLLKRDLALATRVMAELLPGFMREATAVLFEHSPGRGNPTYTGDHSAFDAVIKGTSPRGSRVFVAFEVKYSETLQENPPRTFSERLTEIAVSSDLFVDAELSGLWHNPIQQLFREHCLAQSMLDRDLADVGLFVLVAPELNHLAQDAARAYGTYLNAPRAGHAQFVNLTLERVVEAIAAAGLETYARLLHRRYADWWLLDGELALDDPTDPFVDLTGTDLTAARAAADP
ncbi:PGN_0703 family putative restriction endonuclease [Devosia sp.]|uniref:PGN_0703 family putative restriction endonuclease n=1 Tax=Devosia sp. TaxID=1871048 RepID=UPI003F70D38A